MSIPLKPYATLLRDSVAIAQGVAQGLLSFATGSVELALMSGNAGIAVWLEYVGMAVLAKTRLSTSVGADVDSFIADFGMTRLVGVQATGMVTMTSFTPGQGSAVIAPGAIVKTITGVGYAVTQDSSISTWSDTSGGYVRQQGVASINVPVQAVSPGASGNAAVGAVCLLGSAVSGIDTVTNQSPFVTGSDQETDAQVRTRFPLWLAAKATASAAAVGSAIADVQNGVTYNLADGRKPDGSAQPGYFTATVDDGSGLAPDSLLNEIYASIAATKALGVQFAVQRPIDIFTNVIMTVIVPAGSDISAVTSAIADAITADISATSVGAGYEYSRLGYLAYSSAGVDVVGVTNVTLNGGTSDIPPQSNTVVRPGGTEISVVYPQ